MASFDIHRFLCSDFSICYDGLEVIRDLNVTSQSITYPPYDDHLLYTFEVRCSSYSEHMSQFVRSPNTYLIDGEGSKCPFFIDSYEMITHNVEMTDMSGAYSIFPGMTEVILYGHIDSRDLDITAPAIKKKKKKKRVVPINSRFEILDL